jgi:hypothetical protein
VSTGAKIAIGCAVAFVVGVIGVAAVVFGGLWWAKGKVDQVTATEHRIDELKKQANAVPFEAPADGVLREDRLVKFIDIRRRVFTVYEKHKDELEAMNKKEKADFSDVTKGLSVLSEVRTAQAQALADVGMSENEYRFFVEQVYKTLWAAEVAKQTGGKSVSEAAGEAYDKAADELEKTRQAAEAGASREIPKDAALTPEQRKALEDQREAAKKGIADMEKGLADMRKQGAEARENAKSLDAPPANIALFRKYEADIKKYAMGGLEWLGL